MVQPPFLLVKAPFSLVKAMILAEPSGRAHSFGSSRMAEGKSIGGNWRPVSFWMLDLGAGGHGGHQT